MAGTKSDVLPKEPMGDSSAEPIWRSVGYALTRWESLQSALAFLFVHVAQCANNYAVHRAFGYNMAVVAKLDMIEHAAATTFGQHELFTKTRSALNRIKGFNERRNDIAHGIVTKFESTDGTDTGCYLAPSITTTKKIKIPLAPEYCWTAAQIERYARAFAELENEVRALTEDIRQHFSSK